MRPLSSEWWLVRTLGEVCQHANVCDTEEQRQRRYVLIENRSKQWMRTEQVGWLLRGQVSPSRNSLPEDKQAEIELLEDDLMGLLPYMVTISCPLRGI